MAAGVLWLLLWGHQMVTHGTTELNEKELFLGLTWMDSAKLYVVPLALFFVGLLAAHRAAGGAARLGRAGFALSAAGLLVVVVGTAVEFWGFPWGSYVETFEDPSAGSGGTIQAAGSVVLGLALIPFAAGLVQASVLPWWGAVVLVLSGPTTIFMSPAFPIPGLAWFVFGALLGRPWSEARRTAAG